MDTDKKQPILTNTFSGGMDTDTSDALILSSKYRMARNVRYITDTDENTGELHLIEGAKKILDTEGLIIASTSIRDIGIYVVQKTDSWSIYTIKESDTTPFLVFGPCEEQLGERLSLVTRYESETIIKLYIADGKHQIMSLSLTDFNGQNISDILSHQQITLNKPVFVKYTEGILKAGLVLYSYRLYNKHSDTSFISPTTELIPIGKNEEINIINGLEQDEKSNCGVQLRINVLSDKFEKYIIYRIHYYQNGQNPNVSIISDAKIPASGTISIIDNGKEPLSYVTLEEYNNVAGLIIKPKSIETKNDYLFASGIKYGSFYDDDETKKEFEEWDSRTYRFKKNGATYETKIKYYDTDESQIVPYSDIKNISVTHDCFLPDNDINHYSSEDYMYNTAGFIGGTGVNITWKFVTQQIPVDYCSTSNDTLMKKNNLITTAIPRSLQRDELYRFGIVLYDEYGNASPVKWIADIRTPSVARSQPYIKESKNGVDYLYANILGIEFTVSKLPKHCKAFEIVRCKRTNKDISIISQGVVSKPWRFNQLETQDKDTNFIYNPTGLLTVCPVISYSNSDNALFRATNEYNKNILQFVSAEAVYTPESFKDIIKNKNLRLEPVQYVSPLHENGWYMHNLKLWDLFFIEQPSYLQRIFTTEPQMLRLMYFGELYTNLFTVNDTKYENWYDAAKQIHQYGKLYNFDPIVRLHSGLDVNVYLKKLSVNIDEIVQANEFTWSDLAVTGDSDFNFLDNTITINNNQYTNWVGGKLAQRGITTKTLSEKTSGNLPQNSSEVPDIYHEVMGPGGRCFVLNIEDDSIYEGKRSWLFDVETTDVHYSGEDAAQVSNIGTYICNIRQQVIPYGGYTYTDRQLNTYYSNGDYFINDKRSIVATVFNGDCVLNPLEYVSMHKYYDNKVSKSITSCIVYSIPLETTINTLYTYGNEFSSVYNKENTISTNLLIKASNVNNLYHLTKPLYLYNTAYSSVSSAKPFDALNDDYIEDNYNTVDYRVCCSNIKSNNEYEDSWLKFDSADYIDVDTRYGKIVNLRTFKNQLVFWQENATGILSVNERMLIQDKSNLPLILGTGGVLERYDYVTTSNGMKDGEFDDEQSDSALYWWDGNKKEICMYSGGQVVPLSKTKSVLNYINDINEEDMSNDIHFAYDHKYNELLCRISADDGVIVYNEQQQLFTSLYDVNPNRSIKFNDGLYLISPSSIYEWNNRTDLGSKGLADNIALTPYVKYVVNENPSVVKVFDNAEIGGEFNKDSMNFEFNTKGQQAKTDGNCITNREYTYKFAIPRADDADYGNRLRGKTMQCELTSSSNSDDFSLQYINTKYRISWN